LLRRRSLFHTARMAVGNTVTTSAPITTNRDLSRRSMGEKPHLFRRHTAVVIGPVTLGAFVVHLFL